MLYSIKPFAGGSGGLSPHFNGSENIGLMPNLYNCLRWSVMIMTLTDDDTLILLSRLLTDDDTLMLLTDDDTLKVPSKAQRKDPRTL